MSQTNNYREYIKSSCWRVVRGQIVDPEAVCVFCGVGNKGCKKLYGVGLDAHHRHYEKPFGSEASDDLLCVCRNCHRILHGQPYERYPMWEAWTMIDGRLKSLEDMFLSEVLITIDPSILSWQQKIVRSSHPDDFDLQKFQKNIERQLYLRDIFSEALSRYSEN